ncbi:MAG: hypothetical protein PHH58_07635 [Rhodoferax sp.]|nr:hypothetical protein [Rhodoferax sp.]PIQ50972.1 MAG: hypothetical protein COW02_17540 [Comamonadaceae bacterium CG12_big_fil_rev_8_21_14_0_65_59_15]
MPGSLFDTNVWLAATFPKHPFHPIAQQVIKQGTPSQPAVWCRATEQSFVRLASTATIHRAYQALGLTNRSVWMALDALQALPQVTWRDEPPGLFDLWRTLATLDSASPKVWMDAYLAAFAIAGGLRMTTLDKDFKNFVPHGLDLELLGS